MKIFRSPHVIKYAFLGLLTSRLIKFIRGFRNLCLYLISPFEHLLGISNANVPPSYIRRYSGNSKNVLITGKEFFTYLIEIANLKPNEKMFDIGCGCGGVALPLTKYLHNKSGKYVGMDIHKKSIDWSRKNISRYYSNFTFFCADIKNEIYNNAGSSATKYRFPLDEQFDVILLKSVFTHMRQEEVDNYFSEISRLLDTNGRCLVTFFLLNNAQRNLEAKGLNKLFFRFGNKYWKYAYEKTPEIACAYEEKYVIQLASKYNLSPLKTLYGSWSGRTDGTSFQDIILLGKKT